MNKKTYTNIIKEVTERVPDNFVSQYAVSTRLPTATGMVDPHTLTGDKSLSVDHSLMDFPSEAPTKVKLVAKLKEPIHNFKKKIKGVDTRVSRDNFHMIDPNLRSVQDPDEFISKFGSSMKRNLNWQMRQPSSSTEIDERSKNWYEGANRLAGHFGKRFGLQHHVAAAVIATQSPQQDWYKNISLAERLMKIHTTHQKTGWSPEMEKISSKVFNTTEEHQTILSAIKGKSLGELQNPLHKGAWIRTYDEAHHNRHYRNATPEGDLGKHITNADGKTKTSISWGNFGVIAKGVKAIESLGEMKKLSESLGEEHKVRSFYNNILQPNSPKKSKTLDTHFGGSAHADPAGTGQHYEMGVLFGNTAYSNRTGQGGSQSIASKALDDVSDDHGIQVPARTQAKLWVKRKEMVDRLSDAQQAQILIHQRQHANGIITQDQLHKHITDIAGEPIKIEDDHETSKGHQSTFESVVNTTFNTLLEKIHQNKLLKKLAMKYNTSPVARPEFVRRIPTARRDGGKILPTLLTYKTASNTPRSDVNTEIATDDIDLGTRERVKNQAIKNWEDRTQASSESGKQRERFIDKATSSGNDDILRRANKLAFQKRKAHNSDIQKFGVRPEPHFTGNALGNIVDVMIRSVRNRTNQSQQANTNLPAVGSGHY